MVPGNLHAGMLHYLRAFALALGQHGVGFNP